MASPSRGARVGAVGRGVEQQCTLSLCWSSEPLCYLLISITFWLKFFNQSLKFSYFIHRSFFLTRWNPSAREQAGAADGCIVLCFSLCWFSSSPRLVFIVSTVFTVLMILYSTFPWVSLIISNILCFEPSSQQGNSARVGVVAVFTCFVPLYAGFPSLCAVGNSCHFTEAFPKSIWKYGSSLVLKVFSAWDGYRPSLFSHRGLNCDTTPLNFFFKSQYHSMTNTLYLWSAFLRLIVRVTSSILPINIGMLSALLRIFAP